MTIVAIDGPTGVGKSTTARAVTEDLGALMLLDPVSVSPLLDEYYNGEATPSAAIDTELAFLRSRSELLASAPDGELVVCDFGVMRTAPFAEFLDDPSDRERVLDEMRMAIVNGPQLDVLVLLNAQPASLFERVRTRDRAAENDLTIEHLAALSTHFESWRDEMLGQARTAIVIDTERWDPRDEADRRSLVGRIRRALD